MRLPQPCASTRSAMALMPSELGMPSKGPELTWSPASRYAESSSLPSQPGGAMTTLMGRSYFLAKSKSRWSWAGTPMTAPVP